MKIKLKKLILTNFKGVKDLTVTMDNDIVTISGENATGKSTIFDAFTFLLFGKNQFDQKDFGVKTWDKNGAIIPKIDHSVTGLLDVDGIELKLTRTIKEKWVKRRGEETTEFSGNETEYFINDVPKQQREYQEYVSAIIPEATFKLLTSPYYYNNLKMEDRRAMLMSIAGEPNDEETAGNDLKDVLLKMRAESKSIKDLKLEYASKKKLLKDAIQQIPARIDEATRSMPDSVDFAAIERDIVEKGKEIIRIDGLINDRSKAFDQQFEAIKGKQTEINNLRLQIQELENGEQRRINQEGQTLQTLKATFNAKRENLQTVSESIAAYQRQIEFKENTIKQNSATMETLRGNWSDENAKEISFSESDTICPTCKQSLPANDIESQRETMLNNFNLIKANDLKRISSEGKRLKDENTLIEGQISELKTWIGNLTEDANELKKWIAENPIQDQPATEQNELPEVTKIKGQIKQIEAEMVNSPALDISDLTAQKQAIQGEIDILNTTLGTKAVIERTKARIAELNKEEKNLAQQIADLEKFEYQIEQFTKRKITEVERRVNSMFIAVKFRMFNTLINGGDEPACDTLINGVPFPDANHAGQINAGIEIINVFSKVHNCFAPIWIDNAESNNNITPSESQMIKLVVTKDKSLIIN